MTEGQGTKQTGPTGSQFTSFGVHGPDLSWVDDAVLAEQIVSARMTHYTRYAQTHRYHLLGRMRIACLILAKIRQTGGGNAEIDGALSACLLVAAFLQSGQHLIDMTSENDYERH